MNPETWSEDARLTRAQLEVEQRVAGDPGVHTVYQGRKVVAGSTTAVPCITCLVGQKLTARTLADPSNPHVPIPPEVVVEGQRIPTDIIEEVPPDIRLLMLGGPQPQSAPLSATTHRQCHNSPVPAGVQISPDGANWVGTLGYAIRIRSGGETYYCGITNAHVSGFDGAGRTMRQPSSQHGHIGAIKRVFPIQMGGPANSVDLAIIDAHRTDGPYAPLTHTVQPIHLDIGRLNPSPATPSIGMAVTKSGRTTGVTTGEIVGLNATSRVSYGRDGTATFTGQLIIRSGSGQFSDAGDSGSGILTTDRRPVGLLFAGGGNTTIANPISLVLAALNTNATAEFF